MLIRSQYGPAYRKMQAVGSAVVDDLNIGIFYEIHILAIGAVDAEFAGLLFGSLLGYAGNRRHFAQAALANTFDMGRCRQSRANDACFKFGHTSTPIRERPKRVISLPELKQAANK